MAALRILLLSVAAAVVYGVLHDQVTVRVCIEYFTIGHPPVFPTESPTLLALGWGVIATWWVGVLLGLPLAFAARLGRRPPRSAVSLVRPIAILLAVMAVSAAVAGFVGHALADAGSVFLLEPLASRVPKARHAVFQACLCAHSASYLVGFLGGAALCQRVWLLRSLPNAGRS